METIDVLPRAFVVKWVNVPAGATVVFQAKPLKRSICLAVYRTAGEQEGPLLDADDAFNRKRSNSALSLTLEERIQKSSLSLVNNYGQLTGNQLFKNKFKVEQAGIYAFIFDNTSAKSYSKKVLFNKFFVGDSPRPQMNSSSSSLHSRQLYPDRGQFLQGYLLKKKRKKLQGFTKRFFILNFKYDTLSYYQNENSLKIRGEMQINISTISASKETNTIVIDSGMDIWLLKTLNEQDWDNWIHALDFIKLNGNSNPQNENVETNSPIYSPELTPTEQSPKIPLGGYGKNNDTQLHDIYSKLAAIPQQMTAANTEATRLKIFELATQLKSLIKLDTNSATASLFSQDYFDAVDTLDDHVLILSDQKRSSFSVDELSDDDDSINNISRLQINEIEEEAEVETGDLYPLPLKPMKRRNVIRPSTSMPPSLFSFLRKNIGKDLSTISMPVTYNEPLTILQKIAEGLEFAELVDDAAKESNLDLKLIKIAVFAISCLGSFRSKERNQRKPFNPILGETFEFVNPEKNYRLIGEKVSHKPQIFSFHADSPLWDIHLTLNPDQKFWGKSIEIINKGSVRLHLKTTGEVFKWCQPSTIVKNIIAGDRYSEPANSSLSITSSEGKRAILEFKKPNGGLFGQARSEEVSIHVSDGRKKSDLFAQGKWTESIFLKSTKDANMNKKLWTASTLPPDEAKKWGFTIFASNLNEITKIEEGLIPPTDSRLRPDVRSYEDGLVDKAEELKLTLEQTQREERGRLAESGESYVPNFFKKVDDLEYEIIKTPGLSYWDRRKKGDWSGIKELW